MTPEQKLKHMILAKLAEWSKEPLPEVTAENVDALYDAAREADDDSMQDVIEEIRCTGEETNIPAPRSRHYEARSVAAKALDGSWVGWTQWYGGGKHGEPGEVEWMDDAYSLECKEEEKLLIVRTFTKPE